MYTGAQYAVDYGPSLTWIVDLNVPAVTLGTSPAGIAVGFGMPLPGLESRRSAH
jgi:hypothetical protein